MGVNKYRAHVWVVPEDDATRQLANGFLLHPSLDETCIDIRPAVGGWPKVLEKFGASHLVDLRKYTLRHLVLLIDFDDKFDSRIEYFRGQFPDDVLDRVYVIGVCSEPEPLRIDIGMSLEKIGNALADACANHELGLWSHDLLRHNEAELIRLTVGVRPFLFR